MVEPDPFVDDRARMVETQIARRGVRDPRVLAAMRAVPRHRFVPPELQPEAYADRPLSIGFGQTISQPYVVAYMVEQLQLDPDDRVLEIGAGCGYQTAVLAAVARLVYSIEIVGPLAMRARATLEALGVHNVEIRHGDGYAGWPEHGPFDGIVVSAAPREVPPPLVEQLAVGGRLVVPVGEELQEIIAITRTSEGVDEERLIPVKFVPLTRNGRHQ
jgi:protein-L-isoaspartate(D-aspartate) O-methyltransferase